MMLYRNVLNFLRGSVQVEIECACPERVLNLLDIAPAPASSQWQGLPVAASEQSTADRQ